MNEHDFARLVADFLRRKLEPKGLLVENNTSLLYSLTIDEHGNIPRPEGGDPKRGNDAFEQDILVWEKAGENCDVNQIPRVVIETKLRVTTHDAVVYSQKARLLKGVYPYLRYFLLLGDHKTVPPRVLKHGADFDVVVAFPIEPANLSNELDNLLELVLEELKKSTELPKILRGQVWVKVWQRSLSWVLSEDATLRAAAP